MMDFERGAGNDCNDGFVSGHGFGAVIQKRVEVRSEI